MRLLIAVVTLELTLCSCATLRAHPDFDEPVWVVDVRQRSEASVGLAMTPGPDRGATLEGLREMGYDPVDRTAAWSFLGGIKDTADGQVPAALIEKRNALFKMCTQWSDMTPATASSLRHAARRGSGALGGGSWMMTSATLCWGEMQAALFDELVQTELPGAVVFVGAWQKLATGTQSHTLGGPATIAIAYAPGAPTAQRVQLRGNVPLRAALLALAAQGREIDRAVEPPPPEPLSASNPALNLDFGFRPGLKWELTPPKKSDERNHKLRDAHGEATALAVVQHDKCAAQLPKKITVAPAGNAIALEAEATWSRQRMGTGNSTACTVMGVHGTHAPYRIRYALRCREMPPVYLGPIAEADLIERGGRHVVDNLLLHLVGEKCGQKTRVVQNALAAEERKAGRERRRQERNARREEDARAEGQPAPTPELSRDATCTEMVEAVPPLKPLFASAETTRKTMGDTSVSLAQWHKQAEQTAQLTNAQHDVVHHLLCAQRLNVDPCLAPLALHCEAMDYRIEYTALKKARPLKPYERLALNNDIVGGPRDFAAAQCCGDFGCPEGHVGLPSSLPLVDVAHLAKRTDDIGRSAQASLEQTATSLETGACTCFPPDEEHRQHFLQMLRKAAPDMAGAPRAAIRRIIAAVDKGLPEKTCRPPR